MKKGRLIQLLLFAVAFFAFGEFGLLLRTGEVAPIWPASGVAAAAFAVVPKRRWQWLIALLGMVNIAGNLLHGTSLPMSLGFALANVSEGLVAGWIIGANLPQRRRMVRSRDVTMVASAAMAGGAAGAAIGATMLALSVGGSFFGVFPGWFVSDAVGILVFGPATLAVVAFFKDPSPRPRLTRAVGLMAGMVIVYPLAANLNIGIYFLVLVPLIASAYTLGTRLTSILLAFNAVATMLLAAAIAFPETLAESELTAQMFIGVLQVTVLALAAEAGRANRSMVELQSVFDAAVEAVLVVDEKGLILQANTGAAHIFDRDVKSLVGSVVSEHLRSDDFEVVPSPGAVSQVLGVRSDESTFPAEVTVGSITDPFGKVRRALIARDITERQEAESARDRFVSAMTHELRNPLTGMLGMAALTLDDMDEIDHDELRTRLEMIHSDGESLANIIDDLLSIKKLESSSTGDHETVDLAALVTDSADRLRAAATVRDIGLDVEVVETTVDGDPSQLGRAVQNLISNAIKYSHEGSDIDVSLRHVGESAVVEVSDNGIGIPADEVEAVLGRFYRASNSGDTNAGGTGLGLALVGETMRRHQGSLGLESVEGKGTTVTLTLPRLPGAVPALPEPVTI